MQWWKWISAVLIIYSVAAGLLIPLNLGILSVQPVTPEIADRSALIVTGYNTGFEEEDDFFLKLGDHYLKAMDHEIIAPSKARVYFNLEGPIPEDTKEAYATLIYSDRSGLTGIMPDAVNLNHLPRGGSVWIEGPPIMLEPRWALKFPYRSILEETIRNTYYHVPLWFAMIAILAIACIYSINILRKDLKDDSSVVAYSLTGLIFGILGLLTGAIWAKFTWNAWWSWDIKQTMAAIAIFIYIAYFVLRYSIDDPDKRSRIASAYNIFAFLTLIPLLFIIPRMQASLHPGSGGNPAMGGEDLDNTMRLIFYPAVLGWILLGIWLSQINYRLQRVKKWIQLQKYYAAK